MLVLARKKKESIVIGDIRITVVDIRGGKVRVGIEAPAKVPVYRREVYDRIHADRPVLGRDGEIGDAVENTAGGTADRGIAGPSTIAGFLGG